METYCVSRKKYTDNKNWSVRKAKKNRLNLPSNSAVCDKRKYTFIRIKEFHNFDYLKKNKIIDQFLLTWYKFMP